MKLNLNCSFINQQAVMTLLKKAVTQIREDPTMPSEQSAYGTPTGEATRYLHEISRILDALPRKEIEAILKQVMGKSGPAQELEQ